MASGDGVASTRSKGRDLHHEGGGTSDAVGRFHCVLACGLHVQCYREVKTSRAFNTRSLSIPHIHRDSHSIRTVFAKIRTVGPCSLCGAVRTPRARGGPREPRFNVRSHNHRDSQPNYANGPPCVPQRTRTDNNQHSTRRPPVEKVTGLWHKPQSVQSLRFHVPGPPEPMPPHAGKGKLL